MDIKLIAPKDLPETKRCIGCHKAKKLSKDPRKAEFYHHPDMHDGHLTRCKACFRAGMKKRSAARRLAAGVTPRKSRTAPKKPPAKKGAPTKKSAPKKKHPTKPSLVVVA